MALEFNLKENEASPPLPTSDGVEEPNMNGSQASEFGWPRSDSCKALEEVVSLEVFPSRSSVSKSGGFSSSLPELDWTILQGIMQDNTVKCKDSSV